jgi:hypothetical protein
MAYEGEELNYCPPKMFDFTKAFAVVVSGASFNPYGHMLLNTGGRIGMYFQVAGVNTRPLFMNETGYQRYLSETKKIELKRFSVFIPHPEASQLKLEQILNRNWHWGAVVNNCETLVEDIIVAGGGPKVHRGVFSLPTKSGWSAWNCGAQSCPSHASRSHHCASGVWVCSRVSPKCLGHSSYKHQCNTGLYWTCRSKNCPTHTSSNHNCQIGIWACGRRVPPCPGHTNPSHQCSEQP